jgi:hypothetical protein
LDFGLSRLIAAIKENDTGIQHGLQSRCDEKPARRKLLLKRAYACPSNRVAASSGISRRGTIVVVQHAAQTLTAQHRSTMTSFAFIGHNQAVAETLVVSLAVIVQNELVNSLAQCPFTKEDHSVQAGLLDAANEALRIGIQMSPQMRRMAALRIDLSE